MNDNSLPGPSGYVPFSREALGNQQLVLRQRFHISLGSDFGRLTDASRPLALRLNNQSPGRIQIVDPP